MQTRVPSGRKEAGAALVAVLLALATSGCLGTGGTGSGTGAYAQYRHRTQALEQIDAMLATFPQYPGARLSHRQDTGRSYKIARQTSIEAAPYSSDLSYELPQTVTAPQIRRWFRRVLTARGWRCTFNIRSRGVPYRFDCTRGRRAIHAYVADRGHYELVVFASDAVPPIPTVPGD